MCAYRSASRREARLASRSPRRARERSRRCATVETSAPWPPPASGGACRCKFFLKNDISAKLPGASPDPQPRHEPIRLRPLPRRTGAPARPRGGAPAGRPELFDSKSSHAQVLDIARRGAKKIWQNLPRPFPPPAISSTWRSGRCAIPHVCVSQRRFPDVWRRRPSLDRRGCQPISSQRARLGPDGRPS